MAKKLKRQPSSYKVKRPKAMTDAEFDSLMARMDAEHLELLEAVDAYVDLQPDKKDSGAAVGAAIELMRRMGRQDKPGASRKLSAPKKLRGAKKPIE
jgi:hypothetical protein